MAKKKKDTSIIPKGYYCYDHDENDKMVVCPYWYKNEKLPEHWSGYCKYLEKGDWELKREEEFQIIRKGKVVKTLKGKDLDMPVSLIWDMVKECNINMEEE